MNNSFTLDCLIDISVSTTVSEIIDLAERVPTHLITPSALTSTAFTFQACDTKAGTFKALTDEAGTAVSVTVAASKVVSLGNILTHFYGLRYLKIIAGTAEQADRTIGVQVRPVA